MQSQVLVSKSHIAHEHCTLFVEALLLSHSKVGRVVVYGQVLDGDDCLCTSPPLQSKMGEIKFRTSMSAARVLH